MGNVGSRYYGRPNSDTELSVQQQQPQLISRSSDVPTTHQSEREPEPSPESTGEEDDVGEEEGPTMEEIYARIKQGNKVSHYGRQNYDTKPSGGEIPVKLPQRMKKSATKKSNNNGKENVGVAGKKATPLKKAEKKRESVGVKIASIREGREDEGVVVESTSVDAKADDFINRPQPEPTPVSSGKSRPQVSPGCPNLSSNTKPSGDKSNNGVKSFADVFMKFNKQLLSHRGVKNMFTISATTQSSRGAKTMSGGMMMELGGVADEVVVSDKSSQKRDSVPLMGPTNQAKDLITELLQDGSSLGSEIYVAAIVGVGASGKATLRQILFNAAKKSSIFSFKAWISVGEVFDVLHITRSLLMSSGYCFEDNACNDLDVHQRNLFKMIAGKRFLIILEDIGTTNLEASWDNLLLSLKSTAKGSLIIVIANNKEVVDIIHPAFTFYSLQPFINAFFDSDSMTKLSPAQQYVLKKSIGELDRLVDFFDAGVTKGKQKEVLSTNSSIEEACSSEAERSLPLWLVDSAFCCLRTLQLDNCSNCTSLPSLGKLPSLVYLSIKNFQRLEIVGPEFYGDISSSQFTPFGKLEILHFEDLPQWHTWDECEGRAFPNLQELSLIECSRLVGKLPAELLSLRKLEILDCEQLNILLPQLPHLTKLKLQNCELVDLATINNFSSLTSLDMSFKDENNTFVPNLENLTSLSYLRIAGLTNLCTFNELKLPSELDTLFISQPVDILTSPLSSSYDSVELLPSLHVLRFMPSSVTSLRIGGFKDLDLPQHSYMSLQYLSIHDCYLSEPLHFPLGSFFMLEFLEIKNCFHLESFDVTSASGHEICLPLLNELSIDNCPNLQSFPGEGFAAPNLRTLSITNCKNLLSLPEDMHTCMTSLLSLSLKDCPDLDSFPKGCLPSSLQSLHIRYCKRLTSNWKQWKLEQLVSLKRLEIQGCEEVECFPPQGWLPETLTTLVIAHFPALVFLIGEALQQLTSLQELQIVYCQELLSLPEEGLPPSLKYLGIHFCPLVKERCQKDEGEDWPKISNLPHVFIDCQEI